MDETPILPAHIEDTVQAIARLHADHQQEAGALQRLVERLTAGIGRPRFLALLTVAVVLWVGANLLALRAGTEPWDAPPFAWLQAALGVMALYVTVLILATQRREDQLAGYREQLTLELAIVGEQKSAKIIALLEEMRRDDPALRNRVDEEARDVGGRRPAGGAGRDQGQRGAGPGAGAGDAGERAGPAGRHPGPRREDGARAGVNGPPEFLRQGGQGRGPAFKHGPQAPPKARLWSPLLKQGRSRGGSPPP